MVQHRTLGQVVLRGKRKYEGSTHTRHASCQRSSGQTPQSGGLGGERSGPICDTASCDAWEPHIFVWNRRSEVKSLFAEPCFPPDPHKLAASFSGFTGHHTAHQHTKIMPAQQHTTDCMPAARLPPQILTPPTCQGWLRGVEPQPMPTSTLSASVVCATEISMNKPISERTMNHTKIRA